MSSRPNGQKPEISSPGGTPAIARLIRSRRKTVALVVAPDGSLEVRAPLHLPRHQIETIVSEKSEWILKQQLLLKQSILPTCRELSEGVHLWYLGKAVALHTTRQNKDRLVFSDGFLLSQNRLPQAEKILTAWYKARARQILIQRVEFFARYHHLPIRSVRITSARTRWGSCSRDNGLSFTWRLIMAPPEIIDYIVIHELAHVLEKNHSRAFWAQVERMLPDYKNHRAWLKTNGRLLDLFIEADPASLQ